MDDKQLLELAAKAAGLLDVYGYHEETGLWYGDNEIWNPLEDDGDCLRLAVMLGIGQRYHQGWFEVFHPKIGCADHFFRSGVDPLVTVRRAIVDAAAKIGESM